MPMHRRFSADQGSGMLLECAIRNYPIKFRYRSTHMEIREVTLPEMLDARDRRAYIQAQMLNKALDRKSVV